jgi:hypothetical protein
MEAAVKEANNPPDFYIPEHKWVEEVKQLAHKSAAKSLFARVQWSLGDLSASGFQPQVNERTLHIPLQRQSLSGLANAYIRISLPRPEQGHYEKQQSETGEVLLTMSYPIGRPPDVFDWTTVQIATNLDFLYLAGSEARLQ